MPAHSRRRHSHRRVLRGALAVLLAVVVVLVILVGVSLWGALRTPGNQSFEAKWADWLRAHHAAPLANAIEQHYYRHRAVPKGGRPTRLNPVPAPRGPATAPARAGVPA